MGRKSRKRVPGIRHHSHRLHPGSISTVQPEPPLLISDKDLHDLKALFQKAFNYEQSEWSLPAPDTWFKSQPWHLRDFITLKDELNSVKNQLSDIEIEKWHLHTGCTHRAGMVIAHLKKTIRPELCTQAWCKFSEILHHLGGIDSMIADKAVHSVHLCEAPGAFVTCFNHLLRSSDPSVEWKWLASTLNPYYEGNTCSQMINDDRFIVHTLDSWCFGSDNTGNIMAEENIHKLKETVSSWKHVNIVTADGSVDCADHPERQEEMVSHLHLSEVAAALCMLSVSGNFVLKMFTLFEAPSISLIYLLCCVFETVDVFKPATSKPGNSEVYVLCKNFKGMSKEMIAVLIKAVGHASSSPMFSEADLPASFIDQHKACCEFFVGHQKQTIQENLTLFEDDSPAAKHRMESLRMCCVDLFMDHYQLCPIDSSYKINQAFQCKGVAAEKSTRSQVNLKRHTGTFTARQQQLKLSWQQRLKDYSEMEITLQNVQQLWMPTKLSPVASSLGYVTGRPINSLTSSPFCDANLLKIYLDFLHNTQCDTDPDFKRFQMGFDSIIEHMILNSSSLNNCTGIKHQMTIEQYGEEPSIFQQYLASRNDLNVTVFKNGTKEQKTLLMEISTFKPEMEIILSAKPLQDLIDSLDKLSPDDHLVLASTPCLTRLSCSVVLLMQRVFKQVFLCFAASSPLVYLFGLNFIQPTKDLISHFNQLNKCEKHLLSAVDSKHLLNSSFHTSIYHMNNIYLKQRLKHLIEENKLS